MHDGIRRAIIFTIVFVLSGAVLFAWRARDDRFDLFDLLSGERAQETRSPNIQLREEPVLDYSDVEVLSRLNQDYISLTAAVTPAVVSISTGRTVSQAVVRHDFFGSHLTNEQRWEPGLGSGVIVSADGYVVTNYHVVKNVEKIEITLADDEDVFPARVVGHHARLDVAILKIVSDEPRTFAHLSLGDSDTVKTGEIVFAVGNPFGFRGTVTHGIISAKNRRLSDSSAELFQTNTIINPGNSGGPLVNIRGEVIGINTAIYAGAQRSGHWQGVGLAISSNDVRDVLDALERRGQPIRGYLGVSYRPTQGARGRQELVQILAVEADSPAEKAGIEAGDIVVEFNGRDVKNFNDFSKRVRRARAGDAVPLKIERGEEEIEIDVVIGELDEDWLVARKDGRQVFDVEVIDRWMRAAGVEVSDVPGNNGVRIRHIDPSSPWVSKLRAEDIIVSLGKHSVPDVRSLAFLMGKAQPDQLEIMGVLRYGRNGLMHGTVKVVIPRLQ